MTVLTDVSSRGLNGGTGSLTRSSKLRFLLVEDSATDSELVQTLLQDEFPNADFDVAGSLDQALRCLAASAYDLVLADLSLPDAAGETVVRAVREACPETALMVLTGRVDGTLALWTLAEGAQDYLVKGEHDGPRLAEALLHGLQRSRTEQNARARLVAALTLESEAAEKLRALDQSKNDFVATVSHELRTPLTSIAAYAEVLQDEVGLTPQQAGFVDAVARNAARLTALIDDLLTLSGFSSPEPQVAMGEVDLGAVASAAQEVVETLGTDKNLAICFEAPTTHPVLVTGDAVRLERVVLNLLSNAIKFSEDGGTVTCRLTSTATEVFLEVVDTGLGIPPAEQEKLFTRFFRGSHAHERAIQGTGLGLHIAWSIVHDHGGELTVDSAIGGGTTFTVRLPARAHPGAHPGTHPGTHLGTQHPVTASPAQMMARFVDLLSLPGEDPEVGDIVAMLHAALETARQTQQWDLLGDALRFAQLRLETRGLSRAGLSGIGAALAEAADPLLAGDVADHLADLLAQDAQDAHELYSSSTPVPTLGTLAASYVNHLVRGDRPEAVALVRRAVTAGMDASAVLLDVLEPAQREVGRLWASGSVSVVQEHFCTAVTQLVMTELYAGTVSGEDRERRLVAVHAPGSTHHVGLRMVTDVLDTQGWSTTYVGTDIGVESLLRLLADEEADLLLVSASMPEQVPHLAAMVRAVHDDTRTRGVKVVVGGRPFLVAPDLVAVVGADAWARDARAAVDVCHELVGGPRGQS